MKGKGAIPALMASVAVVGSLVIGAPIVLNREPEDTYRRPNILVIVTDDQRAIDTLGAMVETRRWFAAHGTRFVNAFATTPVCCPSRASIFTGRYAHNHGTLSNDDGEALKLDQGSTIQRYLDDAGYFTAMIGRYLNGFPMEATPPHFDRFARCGCPYNDPEVNIDRSLRGVNGYLTDFMTDWTLDRLAETEREDDRPWFLYLAPKAPHSPPVPQARYESAPVKVFRPNPAVREKDVSDKPPYVARGRDRVPATLPSQQLRTLLSVDDMIGELRRALRSLGEERRTLAFFLSDNGLLWGEHGLTGKGVPYKASVRVPLLMTWPGRVDQGVVSRRLVGNIDVAPTILDAAGLQSEQSMDGRSLLTGSARDRILAEMFGSLHDPGLRWASTITKSYQYVEYFDRSDRVTQREYYDLQRDPWQLHNVLGDASETNDPDVRSLSRRLHSDSECAGASCP
jgi:arylsulfatase A-like enzyme